MEDRRIGTVRSSSQELCDEGIKKPRRGDPEAQLNAASVIQRFFRKLSRGAGNRYQLTTNSRITFIPNEVSNVVVPLLRPSLYVYRSGYQVSRATMAPV